MPCHQHRWHLAVATVVLSAIAYGMQDGASHWVPAQAVKEGKLSSAGFSR